MFPLKRRTISVPASEPETSAKRDVYEVQENVSNWISQVQNIPFLNGALIEDITLESGANTINHGLNRKPAGWFFTRLEGQASISATQTASDESSIEITVAFSSGSEVEADLWIW